jgi:hypothetical protein
MITKRHQHPEAQKDEIFLGNVCECNHIKYICGYKTARRGNVAYDIDGNVLKGCFPILVKITEVNNLMVFNGIKKPYFYEDLDG